MADQTFAPVEFVAKTGRPMWSARTKLTTPPSMTAMGSQPFQTYSRISAPVGGGKSPVLEHNLQECVGPLNNDWPRLLTEYRV